MTHTIFKSVTCSLCILNTLGSSPVGWSFIPLVNPLRKSNSTMRAIRMHSFGDPSVLKLESNVPVPEPSSGQQVLVKVHAAGINPVDGLQRERAFSFQPKLPLILGKEAAGDIVSFGEGNSSHDQQHKYKPGDRVICCLPFDGGYAEYVVCDLDDILRLPPKLSYSQGAAIYVAYFTAYRGLVSKLNVKENDLVLVHGASGAVGMAAVQIAKSLGAVVVGTAGTEEGKDMVKGLGADYVVNHREKSHLTHAMKAIPHRKGFDAILENRASSNLYEDLTVLAPNGRIAVVGATECTEIDPRCLIKSEGYITGVKMSGISRTEWTMYADAILKGMNDGWLKPVIAREYLMEEIQLAHEHLNKKHGHLGKLVLKML